MSEPTSLLTPTPTPAPLLDRVVAILEQARGNVVRAVNTQMVWAYWLIGRPAYSTKVIATAPIQYPAGTKSSGGPIRHPAGDELAGSEAALEGRDLE